MAKALVTEIESAPQTHASSRKVLQAILVATSFGYVALFLLAAALRASYPLQLEWLECGVLDTVGRVLHGQPIYVRPTHLFVPFLYTPLYYYLGAAACWLGGFSFSSLRWFGTVCTVCCFVLQFSMASRLAKSRLAGVVAAGYFAALYATTGWWFDLARVDMLYVALLMGGIYLSWRHRPLAAALVFALALQTKQTAVLVAVCVLAHEYRAPARLIRGLLAFLVLAGASTLALMRLYGPWYLYYTQYIPSHHPLEFRGIPYFFGRDLLYPSLPALLIIFLCGVWAMRRAREATLLPALKTPEPGNFWLANRRFLLATTFGLTVSCFLGRLHTGASVNIALPLDAWLAVLFGASVAAMLRWAGETHTPVAQRRGALILAVAVLQFLALARSPLRYLPSRAARAEAALALDRLAHTRGNLYSLNNAVDVAVVGKQSFANSDAIFDILRAGHSPVSDALERDVNEAFARHDYAALVSSAPIDAPGVSDMDAPASLAQSYRAGTTPLVARKEPLDSFLADRTHPFPRYLSPAKEQ